MEYEFSAGWFFTGFIVLLIGVAFVKWHQWVADNLGSGVASYERYKLYAFITCGLGFIVMLNLHTLVLRWFFSLFFPSA
jgi:hypothetical protein